MKLASARSGVFAVLILVLQACGGADYAEAGQPVAEGNLIVNVNTATLEELESIPGIGEAIAKEIVRERPYKTIEGLIRVKGIGEYTLNSIRPYVTIEGKTRTR